MTDKHKYAQVVLVLLTVTLGAISQVHAALTLESGRASVAADFTGGPLGAQPTNPFSLNVFYDYRDLTTTPTTVQLNSGGWAGISWRVGSTGIRASGSSTEGYNGVYGSNGWVYGRGHADFTATFRLDQNFYYCSSTSGNVAGISSGKGILKANTASNPTYTISAHTLGKAGGYSGTTADTFSLSLSLLGPVSTVDSILKGAVTAGPAPDKASAMVAEFKPKNGVTLKQAANALGFDHFNWEQKITHIPPGWTIQLVDLGGNLIATADVKANGDVVGLRDTNGTLLSPVLDPALNSATSYYRYVRSDGATSTVGLVAGAKDNKPYLLGEDSSLSTLSGNLYYQGPGAPMTTNGVPKAANVAQTLNFSDVPHLAAIDVEVSRNMLGGGANSRALGIYFGLQTSLVGVATDGSEVQLPDGLGLNFSWKTDNVTALVTSQWYLPDDGTISTSLSGGVFDVVTDRTPVPVPGTVWLLGPGLTGLLGIRRKGRREIKKNK